MAHIDRKRRMGGPLLICAHPRVGNMVRLDGARRAEVGALPLIFTESARLAIRMSLGICTKGDVRPDVHNSSSRMGVFRVKEFNIAPRGNAMALLVYDIRPYVRVARSTSTEDFPEVAHNQGVVRLPRIGFFALKYCLRIWSLFLDAPNLEEVRRSLLHERAAHIRAELTERPTEPLTEYD